MLRSPIYISSIGSISALGENSQEVWNAYLNEGHYLSRQEFNGKQEWVGALPASIKSSIQELAQSSSPYADLDDSVLYAIYLARKVTSKANWKVGDTFGINLGSSRGATHLFETFHSTFIEKGHTPTLTSPTTTLGNIASWVGHDLNSKGPNISHSITCSTALHAVLNGVAWLQSGLCDKFLVGGTEAALTPFTLAQMRALKIYSSNAEPFPCRSLDRGKTKNSMVLGEGAAMACLENTKSDNSKLAIVGIGYATEVLKHNVSISTNAQCFQDSMKMALGEFSTSEVDAVVTHTPGTIKGDDSELRAIAEVFGNNLPFLTSNKWKAGHTFGASGMLSLEMAALMIENQHAIPVPFIEYDRVPDQVGMVMVNAVGFGGNAVSILLQVV